MGSVLPREKAGVESVPCRIFTASTARSNVIGGVSAAASGWPVGPVAAWAGFSPRRVEPMAARPVVLRKLRLLVPALLSLMISAKVHSLVAAWGKKQL